MRYAYQYAGGPLVRWGQSAPLQSRAADTVALGSLGGSTLSGPTLVLPAPGAPEPIGVTRGALNGCSCHGSCGCGMGDVFDAVPGGMVGAIAIGAGAFLLWKALKRGRRRSWASRKFGKRRN
jgi:hypothetical protein